MEKGYNCISKLDILYSKGDIFVKRKLIPSIFPEKLTIISGKVRTTKINEAIAIILLINSNLQINKKEDKSKNINLSSMVTPEIQISNHFIEDIKHLIEVIEEGII
ncbi:hypothetical protein [Galbibacter pacificus]|uniref:Uncharacterized protein n=1 Tax=Galbibacter pacificus TaxID=2996052 RepID=A0ABT6FMQ9_9FLAO|nr:hypothetical protein [Galbibacter pacificus]MDG3581074.1 hypothetical protein [Galbibacter pacificus]MDG3584552.1 hypothetical protein [Galbibacter pacificus]